MKRALMVSVAATVVAAGAALAGAQGDDALARAKAKGALTACVDPYNFPFSSNNSDPPGFDIEVVRAFAKRAGLRAVYFWADTGTRGGLGRALRTSILQKKCDFFMGIPLGGDTEEETQEKHLVLSRPYLGLGYILVVGPSAPKATRLADLKSVKIGVPMSTPVDAYLFDNGYDRDLFLRNSEIMKAMAEGKLAAGMVWLPALAQARVHFPDGKFQAVPGYTPEPGLRWNMAIALPAGQPALKQFLDESIGELLKSGEMKAIVEHYGLPYFPPFE